MTRTYTRYDFVETHIYALNLDRSKNLGTLFVRLMKDGEEKHEFIGVGEHGYDGALVRARKVRDEWVAQINKERDEAKRVRTPRHPNVELARQDVDLVILRFGWKEVDDYFGRNKLMMPFHMI